MNNIVNEFLTFKCMETDYKIVHNVFTVQELTDIITMFKRFDPNHTDDVDFIATDYGVSFNHFGLPWFKKKVYQRIKETLEWSDHAEIIFAAFIDVTLPNYNKHLDSYHFYNRNLPGKPYKVCMIPYSVDNNIHAINKASTYVYDQDGERHELIWKVGTAFHWNSDITVHHSSKMVGYDSKQYLLVQTYLPE